MSAVKKISVTAYGQKISGIEIAIGSSVEFDIACQDEDTRTALNLTGGAVQMTLSALDARGNPTQPPLFSRQATIVNSPGVDGRVKILWAPDDTVPSGVPFSPKHYGFDLWFVDGSGNRLQMLAVGVLELTPAATLPATPVTPLPSQALLAQGNLQGAYSAGGVGPQVIQFDALRAGIELRDTGLGSGNPILTIADSTAFVFYQFTSNGLTVNTLASFNSGALVGGSGLFPTSDGSSALGDASNRFFAVAGISYLSGFSPMSFQSEALTSGTNPIFKWTADGDVAANLAGPAYRFNIGSEPLGFLDMLHVSTGTVLLGYRAGTAITGLQFNSLGLIVTADFGGSTNSSHLLPGANAQQFLGLTNNRWLLVAAGISGEFSSSTSPVSVTNAKRSVGVSGSGARTVNLPAASTITRGFEIFVQDTGNSAGAISVTPNGADTINGANAAVSIAAAFGTRRLVCNGVDGWFSSGVF